jgi:hypothetical protein
MGCISMGCGSMGCGRAPDHPEVVAAILVQADQNGDGSIDPDEFSALSLPRQGFAPYDTNHDRRLDAAELEDAFLSASPADFQDEGRRAVHRKYGHPFGQPGGNVEGRRGKRPPRGKGPPPPGGPPPGEGGSPGEPR